MAEVLFKGTRWERVAVRGKHGTYYARRKKKDGEEPSGAQGKGVKGRTPLERNMNRVIAVYKKEGAGGTEAEQYLKKGQSEIKQAFSQGKKEMLQYHKQLKAVRRATGLSSFDSLIKRSGSIYKALKAGNPPRGLGGIRKAASTLQPKLFQEMDRKEKMGKLTEQKKERAIEGFHVSRDIWAKSHHFVDKLWDGIYSIKDARKTTSNEHPKSYDASAKLFDKTWQKFAGEKYKVGAKG